MRFDTAGSLDPSFDGGTVTLHASDWVTPGKVPLGGQLLGIAEQQDGALVAVGFMETQLAIARFTSEGVLDAAFGGDGIVALHAGPPDAAAIASAIGVQSDGKIVVGGSVRQDCDPNDPSCEQFRHALVARFNPDGTLDSAFGTSGFSMLDAGEALTEITQGGVALEPSGRIVVAGDTQSLDGTRYAFVARLTANGMLDVGFGNDGVTLVDSGHGSFAPTGRLGGLALTPTGDRVVAAIDSNDDATTVVAQLAASGGGDPGVIGLVQNGLVVGEGSEARFVVRRTGGAQGTVSVQYSTQLWDPSIYWDDGTPVADTADFQTESGMLTWADGDATERTIAIPLTLDMIVEASESFGFELSNVGGGAALATTDGWVSIVDVNSNAGVLQFATAAVTVDEGLFAVLYVTRTGGSTGAVDLSYGTVDGSAGLDSDFERPTTPLHWEDGDTSPKPIVVPIILDAVTEPDETFRVWLRDPSGGATLGNTMMATVTILDAPSSSTCMTCPRSPTASATQSGGGGSLGPLDLLWLALATLLTRATKLNGDRARSRRPARADDR